MDKIKAFFNNKIVKIVAWVVLALDVVLLILGGASVAEIGKGVELVAGIVSAVALFVAFIASLVNISGIQTCIQDTSELSVIHVQNSQSGYP